MLFKIPDFFKTHSLLAIYLLVLILVFTGMVYTFGFQFWPQIATYLFAFIFFYFLVYRFFKNKKVYIPQISLSKHVPFKIFEQVCFLAIILFMGVHFYYLKGIPVVKAYLSLDYYGIAFIRQKIKELDSPLILYLASFLIKAVLPTLLILLYHKKSKLFIPFFMVAAFYALALIQKSYIFGIVIPLVAYLFLNRKWILMLIFAAVPLFSNYLLILVTNPELRAGKEEITAYIGKQSPDNEVQKFKESIKSESTVAAGEAFVERVFLTTGKVAGYWFKYIPEKLPYAKGCGYHFMAPFLGCNYDDYDYSRKVYNLVYVKEAAKGLKGTATAASFVYDYGNFGYYGLVISAFILALILNVISLVFAGEWSWMMVLNTLPLLWLSSAALSTTLLSGGWFLSIALFFVLKGYITEDVKRID